MSNNTAPKAEEETKQAMKEVALMLFAKVTKLVNEGWSFDAAFADVMGAFHHEFPSLAEKLGLPEN